jgi:transcriptional regulator with XRE-family HTH domain
MSRIMARPSATRRRPTRKADAPAEPAAPQICLLHPDHLEPAAAAKKGTHRGQRPPQIGQRLREIRLRQNMTLSEVESRSGVSKSMLSQIERGKVNPTFARVWHLTRSLGVSVGELLGEVSSHFEEVRQVQHLKVYSTPSITSSDGLCTTRILNPIRFSLPFEWYQMTLEPGGSLRANAHGNGAWEHMTAVSGRVVVEIGTDEVILEAGDTVRYSAEQPHGVRNGHDGQSILLLIVVATKEVAARNIPFGPTAQE